MTSDKQTRQKQQRGIAMVMALLALMILAIIGMGFMYMSSTENSANRNYKDSQKAYFASRAGLENVRALLAQDPNLKAQAIALTMPVPGPATGIIYVYNPDGINAVDPSGAANAATLDDELCQEQFTLLGLASPGLSIRCAVPPPAASYTWAGVPSGNAPPIPLAAGDIPNTNTASALPFKWVRITNKQNFMGLVPAGGQQFVVPGQPAGQQICWDGQREWQTAPGNCPNLSSALAGTMNPVWLLTSLAITPNGGRRMTQMEVAFSPPIFPDATVTAEAHIVIQGNLQVNGYDNCTCTANGAPISPGVACINTHHAISTPNGIDQNGNAATVTAGPNPPSDPNFSPWPYDVPQLISDFVDAGALNVTGQPYNQNCSGMPPSATCKTMTGQNFGVYPQGLPSSPSNWSAQNTYIPGSVSLHGNTSGAGVLIVDGDLDINGGLDFYGLILVRGKISFTGGGSQKVNLYGAILAGEDVGISDSIGGSFNFHYDSCALRLSAPPGPPKLLATHELMF